MDPVEFFRSPTEPMQIRYEAMRAFFLEDWTAEQVATHFGLSPYTVYTLSRDFKRGTLPSFFAELRKGPKGPVKLNDPAKERMIALRKQNLSIEEIAESLKREEFEDFSEKTIRDVLKKEGFTRLFRRTRAERRIYLQASREPTEMADIQLFGAHSRVSTLYGGAFLFLPAIVELKLPVLFEESGFYGSELIPRLQYLLSYLMLKLVGKERLSHIDDLNFDYGLAIAAGLNVLPKAAAITQYSYHHLPGQVRKLLEKWVKVLSDGGLLPGNVINLDFHSIVHWGEESQLETNWVPTRGKSMKSILCFLAQDMESTYLCYANGEVNRDNSSDEILDFVDFYTSSTGRKPACLVFDSDVTTYATLHELNQENILFITLRRRSKSLVNEIEHIKQWKKARLDVPKRRHKSFRYYEKYVTLKNYRGSVRQIFVTGTGHELPMVLISNDFERSVKQLLLRYAKRWRIENNIQENVDFFSLNALSSPVVVKVDFDLAMTLISNTLYKLMASHFERFDSAKPKTVFRTIIEGKADVKISSKKVIVRFAKKAYNPMIRAWAESQPPVRIPWFGGRTLHFEFE